MFKQLQSFERNLQATAITARRELERLSIVDMRPAPKKYLETVQSVQAIAQMWERHILAETVLFSDTLGFDSHFAAFLERVAEESRVIGRQLSALSAAPWPRSTQAGLNSIRLRAAKLFAEVLAQVERERATVLPLMHRRLSAEAVRSADSELVAM